jgi:SAM-dependent methyltransferase
MWFRDARRALFRPVRKRFARTFATRADTEGLTLILAEQSRAIERFEQRVGEIGRQIETLAQRLQETNLEIRPQIETLSQRVETMGQYIETQGQHIDRDVGPQIGQITAILDGLTGSIARADSEIRRGVTERAALGLAISRLETGEQFDRQAIHDIASRLFGGRDRVNEGETSVGIVIPTCDRPDGLRRALHSIAAQSRKPNTVIVVNDGRADISSVVEEFSGRLPISAIKTAVPYSGSSAARNLALDALDTALIAFLDDDNLMWPRWIERAAAFLEADPKIDILYGAQLRDAELSATRKSWFFVPFDFEALQKGNFIDLNQIVHRSSNIRFDQALRRLVDWDYVLRLIGSDPRRIVPVDAVSSIYSTSAADRITLAYWPPDLGQNIVRRQSKGNALSHNMRTCSGCGFVGEFSPGPRQRPDAGCPRCGSLERHRFLQLLGPLLRDFWLPQTRPPALARMIEVAPSVATAPFRNLFGSSTTVDSDPEADGRVVDLVASLTALPTPSEFADVLLALHVLEHIPDDRKAMSEIARVLAPTGLAILQVPMSRQDATDEEIVNTPEERLVRYGQPDHVRLYGKDFYARLSECGLTSVAVSPRESMAPESIAKYGLLPDEPLVFAVRSDASRAKTRLGIFASSLRKGSAIVRLEDHGTAQRI